MCTVSPHRPRWSKPTDPAQPGELLDRGQPRWLGLDEYARMGRHPVVSTVEIPGTGHDVHLDSPDRWRDVLGDFLDSAPRRRT
ncbi:hypothetical protein [Plantactinospora mayteni]|uniref:hypothetical protein n=1 Tax=Plantactinospora mayteni TaxID=566021 RepID=UPI001943975B|nr:hypothetical protein [Plantactinospora mayteni]